MRGIRRLSFLVVSLCLFIVEGCYWGGNPTEPERRQTLDFVLTDLDSLEFKLSDHLGKVVLLQFFATWCEACQAETYILNKLNSNPPDTGLVVVGIAVLVSGGQIGILDFVDDWNVNYRILLDEVVLPEEGLTVAGAYGVESVPVTVIVDREGWIDERQYSVYLTEEDFLEIIEPLL